MKKIDEINRINTYYLKKDYNVIATNLLKQISDFFESNFIQDIEIVNSYHIKSNYSIKDLNRISKEVIIDQILESFKINDYPKYNFHWVVDIHYKSGVTNNIANTLENGIKDLFGRDYNFKTQAKSSKVYFLSCYEKTSYEKIERLVKEFLANPVIEDFEILSQEAFKANSFKELSFQEHYLNESTLKSLYKVIDISSCNDQELIKLSEEKLLALSLKEMQVIKEYYQEKEVQENRKANGLKTEPTDVELEMLAQTWSEHCKHKIFNAIIEYKEKDKSPIVINSIYKTYIKEVTEILAKKRNDLLSVFSDNSGVFSFNEDYAICLKVETHNSPSALDPLGGAMTGIVGVNRDILGTGLGAKPIFNTNVFCFANPYYKKPLPSKIMHPRRIFLGVHKGVEEGGNHSGIPTVNGSMNFDDRFLGKPLVFCGTGGLIPKKILNQNGYDKPLKVNDLIVSVGGRIGKDGIHGATFSSLILEDSSPISAVQIADPITQKKMTDFLLDARDQGLYSTLTDNGAGGLSSSIGEMAQMSNGAEVHLDKCLLKYPNLQPWEILISESQERMTLAVPESKKEALEDLSKLYDVEICFIGKFNDNGYFKAYYNNELVCLLSLDFLHNGLPIMKLKANWEEKKHLEPLTESLKAINHNEVMHSLLKRYNIASKEKWVRQYDHEVKAKTIIKPFDGPERDGPMNACVMKPLFNSYKGIVISHGIVPRYSDIDTYSMASVAIDEAMRNLVAVGGNPHKVFGLDNFCWPDPIESKNNLDGQFKTAQLVRANMALKDICLAYNLPIISGKDSMKNDYGKGKNKISIPPTLLFTTCSIIEDIRKSYTTHFKEVDSLIYLLGDTFNELGGSEFYAYLNFIGNKVPKVNVVSNMKLYSTLNDAMKKYNFILACHDLSDGGLGIALAESAFSGMIGVDINLDKITNKENDLNDISKLYSESCGRFIIEIGKENKAIFEEHFKEVSYSCIGKTTISNLLKVSSKGRIIIEDELDHLKESWKSSLDF